MSTSIHQNTTSDIALNLKEVKAPLPAGVKVVAVGKTHPASLIQEAYDAGHRIFGENKAQELVDKKDQLPGDIEWHFIGHLQRNKVKDIAPFVQYIHSVDRLRLIEEIDKRARQHERVIDILFQVQISGEESKFGLSFENARALLHPDRLKPFEHIRIRGLMGIAANTDDVDLIRDQFRDLKHFFDEMRRKYETIRPRFDELSMGMTHDRDIAVEEGSTMIRVGSAIFGARTYKGPHL